MPTSQEPEIAVEDYLYNKFQAASAPGGVLGVQSNAGGTTGIQFVGRVISPEQNVFPLAVVEFTNYDGDVFGSHRDQVEMHFDILVAVLQPFSAEAADTAQQARLALRNYVNDGNGNGMSPLLRSDRTLGGLVTATWIASL